MIVVDPVVERHLARAVAAYVDAMRRNGMRPPAALVELRAAFGDLNRQQPTEFDADTGPGDPEPMALLLTATEAADVLRLSERSVERLLADGTLPSVLIGRARRIRGEDLRQYVNDLTPTTKERTKQ